MNTDKIGKIGLGNGKAYGHPSRIYHFLAQRRCKFLQKNQYKHGDKLRGKSMGENVQFVQKKYM